MRRAAAWCLALAGVISMGAASALELSHPAPRDLSVLELGLTAAGVLVCAVLGVKVLQRHPGHGMGWLLAAMAAVGGLLTLAEVYAFDAIVRHAGPAWGATSADAVSESSWVVAYAALSSVALLFPTGRLSGPGWRPLAVTCWVAFPGAAALVTMQPGPQDDPFGRVTNPVGVAWVGTGAGQALTACVMAVALGCMAGSAASLMDRFVRADAEARQQIKALLLAASLTPLAFLACVATGSDGLATVLLPLALAVVPLAVGLAVLRYRLYDVDRLINRTLVYSVLTLLLTAAYLGISTLTAQAAPGALSTALGTAVTVLAFRPLRDLAQRGIDARFARASARARVLLRLLTEDLRQGARSPEAVPAVLAEVFEDPGLGVRFRLTQPAWWVDVSGHPADDAGDWQPLGPAEVRSARVVPGLLRDTVLHEGALALEMARLHAEVRAQTAFVAEAHVRIAAAGFEERRRVERDLHDGAQQRLVSLGLQLRRMQRTLPRQASVLSPALDAAVQEIGRTISDLRRLAAGDPPASLERGLASALAELAAGLPVPLDLQLPAARLPDRVEAAAYFVACEAVTNAVKHASASRIHLHAGLVDGDLHVLVRDDGRGGATATGSGLAGLADRVRAHGGTFTLDSPLGAGTTVEAVIPCGS